MNDKTATALLEKDPGADARDNGTVEYQTGFGNTFESETVKGALPQSRNNPRVVPHNLYAEQLSGTAFTAPRSDNQRTWLYRTQPSVSSYDHPSREGFETRACGKFFGRCNPKDSSECSVAYLPLRWKPLDIQQSDFVFGTTLMCQAGDVCTKNGLAIYMYNTQIGFHPDSYMYSADGDFLFVPQLGELEIRTEMGRLLVSPGEILVIPRGIVFQILGENIRGYILEVYNGSFHLPDLGPIGSNGLANARDFLYPTAWTENTKSTSFTVYFKMDSQLFQKITDHSPFNVVAWHGNYLPYKYDLSKFCAVNSVTYDHLDPSIYTVLTCQSERRGTAIADFVIFPPRVMATDENTLRPPWFHRNTMSEFMGLIKGKYDAKEGFMEGGASLHNCMLPHGPDTTTYRKAVADPCDKPVKFEGGLAFMFETCMMLKVSKECQTWLDEKYTDCWKGFETGSTG